MKEKFSKKKRAQIYLKAANHCFEHDWIGCCWSIQLAANPRKNEFLDKDWLILNFPEFFLFEPDEYKTWWWEDESKKSETNCRMIALLLSAEIAKNP